MIQSAMDKFGPWAEMLDTRALVYLKSHRAKQASADLQKAIAMKPTPTTLSSIKTKCAPRRRRARFECAAIGIGATV